MRRICVLFATLFLAIAGFAQEYAFPLTARLQSRIPAGGTPADAFYLPGSADVSCFESTPTGSRYMCLSDSGTIIEWTADNRIRQVADGFVGPLQAKVAPDGTLYVLDLGRGTLSSVLPNGTVTRLMGSGSDRVIRTTMDPKTFDLPLYTLSRDTYTNSVQLGIDPAGNPYLGILREDTTKDNGVDVTKRFLYMFRLENKVTTMTLHWDGSATALAGRTALPTFDALSIDKDRNIFFSMDGQVSRLTPGLQYTALVSGRYTPLNTNPVKQIVQTDDGNIFLYSPSSLNLFRLAFAELRVDLDNFATLNGLIARQGGQLVGLDLNEKRILRYVADPVRFFVPKDVARLLRFIPITGNSAFRAAFDNPISVSTDNLGQVFVVEGNDGAVYKIAANGAVTRVAKSTFSPDNPPPARLTTENVAMDAFPYPIVAVANDFEGRLFMLDRNCSLFIQIGTNTARRAKEFLGNTGCADAALVSDQAKRIHIGFSVQGEIQTGTGDPLSGEWIFTKTYAGGRLRSISLLPSGDLLILEGTPNFWALKRLNTQTQVATRLNIDDSLRTNTNLRLSSASVDFSGRILAVSCCTAGSSNESGRRFLFNFQLSGASVLTGQARPVTLFDGTAEVADRVFSHPRGILIRSNLNRIYYFEDQTFRSQSAVSLPNRQTWTYSPDSGVQELAVPVNPGFGPTAFRTRMTCDRNFEKYVRLGPSAAVAPTQLRLALDTLAAPSRAASCKIELLPIDSTRVMANTTIDMVPDPVKLAAIPTISVLEQLTPFKVDPAQPAVTKTVRLFNNAPNTVDIQLTGALPDGITLTPAKLTLDPKQSGDFTYTITPSQLFRQLYQIPIQATCSACAKPIDMNLSFQISGRTTSIDITAEAALIDIASLNARGVNRLGATSLVLSGLDETDVNIRTDLGAAPAWFSVQKSASTRTDEGKLVLNYDVVLNPAALPVKQTSNIVTFETQTQTGVARRFLTVFFFPEGAAAQRLFESGAAGSTINLGTAKTATVSIPVFSRSDAAAVYSTYTLGGDSGAVAVPSTQGVVGKGSNELLLEVSRTGTSADASEIKDVVVLFANGERLIYTLNVITSPLQASKQNHSGERMIGACSSARLLISPREPGLPFTVVRNVGLRFVLELKDECNQLVNATDKTQVRFTSEPANGNVSVTSVGNGLWEVFWKPDRTVDSIAAKIVAVRGVSEREIYVGTMTLNGRVADSTVPALKSFSIVDAISFQAKTITAPGAFITIYGENLAASEKFGFDTPGVFPTELGGLQVQFNGKPAPLLYTSPTQVNLQVPYDLDNSEYRLVIRRGDLVSAPAALGVGTSSPAIATTAGTGSGQGQVYRVQADGTQAFATPDNAAKPGETILVVTTGLGATNPFFDEGKAVPADNVLNVAGAVQVLIGDVAAGNVQGYLATGQIGIYYVTATVPDGAPTGDAVPVIVRGNGVDSQTVTMAVQANQ